MNRLWVRTSLIISLYSLALLLLLLGGFALGSRFGPREFRGEFDERPDFELMEEDASFWRLIPSGLLRVSLLVGLFGIGAGVLVSRGISRPVSELSEGVRRMGAGDLGHRVTTRARSHELISLAEAINQMSADLQKAEQLRSNLMADVSHELRTPLTVLEGHLRGALDNVMALDEAELANLLRQTQHLIRLVNDLRDLALAEARQLPLQTEELDVGALVREVVWNWEIAAEETAVTLTAAIPAAPLPMTADAGRLHQLLGNLLSNALRHTPSGGTIGVIVTAATAEIQIEIHDSGEGISPAQLPHIFDRFYRVDKSRTRETGGTGLGLAIVKGIVQAHHGTIEAASPGLGEGTRFTITLPRVSDLSGRAGETSG